MSFYVSHPDFFQSLTGKSEVIIDENIFQSLTGKSPIRLSWTHYSITLQVEDAEARSWYENEAATEMWSTRTMQRNVSSQYYQRLLKSQNKPAVHDEMMALTKPLQDKLEYLKTRSLQSSSVSRTTLTTPREAWSRASSTILSHFLWNWVRAFHSLTAKSVSTQRRRITS